MYCKVVCQWSLFSYARTRSSSSVFLCEKLVSKLLYANTTVIIDKSIILRKNLSAH
jgi:hypothetical protein